MMEMSCSTVEWVAETLVLLSPTVLSAGQVVERELRYHAKVRVRSEAGQGVRTRARRCEQQLSQGQTMSHPCESF